MSKANVGRWGLLAGLLALGFAWAQPPNNPKMAKTKSANVDAGQSSALAINQRPAPLPAKVSVHFDRTPLNEVVATLRKQWKINLLLDQTGLSNAMVDEDTPITIHIDDVTPERAMTLFLEPLNLNFTNADNVVQITDSESLKNRYVTYVYPAADIVVSTFGDKPARDVAPLVINLIQDTVDRDIWEPNGGDATIQCDPNTLALAVNAPAATQRGVADVMTALRNQRGRTEELLAQAGLPRLAELRTKLIEQQIAESVRELKQQDAAPPAAGVSPLTSESADRALKEATEARQIAEKALRLAVKLEAQLQPSEPSKKK